MHDEILDIVDENGHIQGAAARAEVHAMGLWHRTVHIWVFAPAIAGGSVLLQKRSRTKDIAPGLLDVSVGGHIDRGEAPEQAAARELGEELGIHVAGSRLFPLGVRQASHRYQNATDNEIQTLFGILDDRPLTGFALRKSEIEAILHVPAREGVELFAGERAALTLEAGEVGSDGAIRFKPCAITETDFVPSLDNYFARAFAAASRLQRGEAHVLI